MTSFVFITHVLHEFFVNSLVGGKNYNDTLLFTPSRCGRELEELCTKLKS